MSAEILGGKYDSPIVVAPTGSNRAFHPDGEIAVAKAAKTGNHLQILSTVATTSIEDAIPHRDAATLRADDQGSHACDACGGSGTFVMPAARPGQDEKRIKFQFSRFVTETEHPADGRISVPAAMTLRHALE